LTPLDTPDAAVAMGFRVLRPDPCTEGSWDRSVRLGLPSSPANERALRLDTAKNGTSRTQRFRAGMVTAQAGSLVLSSGENSGSSHPCSSCAAQPPALHSLQERKNWIGH